jgi:predicted transcriptional regulator
MSTDLPGRKPMIEDVLGPLAAEIMRAVWAEGESTGASVAARLGQQRHHVPAYTTVMTVMGRLYERNLLSRVKRGRQYVYTAAAREDAMIDRLSQAAVDDLIARFGTTAYRQFALRLADADPGTQEQLAELAASHEEA